MARRLRESSGQLGLFDAPAEEPRERRIMTAVQAPRALVGLSTEQVGMLAELSGRARRAICAGCLERLGSLRALGGFRFRQFLWKWDGRSIYPEVEWACAECGRRFRAEGIRPG